MMLKSVGGKRKDKPHSSFISLNDATLEAEAYFFPPPPFTLTGPGRHETNLGDNGNPTGYVCRFVVVTYVEGLGEGL
jgi:hypothetical protein